jgi:hypothetical protein
MKKKLLLSAIIGTFSNLVFAQTSARSDINTAISNWIIPILGFLFIVGTVITILHNMDGIRGKAGADQKEAWFNVGQTVVYILVGISIIYFVVSKVTAISFTV